MPPAESNTRSCDTNADVLFSVPSSVQSEMLLDTNAWIRKGATAFLVHLLWIRRHHSHHDDHTIT